MYVGLCGTVKSANERSRKRAHSIICSYKSIQTQCFPPLCIHLQKMAVLATVRLLAWLPSPVCGVKENWLTPVWVVGSSPNKSALWGVTWNLGRGEKEKEKRGGLMERGEGGCDWPSVFARLREAAPASTLPKRKIGSSGSLPPSSRSAPHCSRTHRATLSLERTNFPNRSPGVSDERTGPPSQLLYGLECLGRL